jgi:hypothetical protein
MRKTIIVIAAVLALAVIIAVGYTARRLFSVVHAVREVTFARAATESLSLPSIAASVIGQRVMADLKLSPHQQERISHIYASLQTDTSSDSGKTAPHKTVSRPVSSALRDSIRAVLTGEQWKRLQNTRSTVTTMRRSWTDYLNDPMVHDVMVQLDLTASQKTQIRSLAKVYTRELATLLAESDPVVRRMRVEGLFDEGWSAARRVLSPAQQTIVETYLTTHRDQIEAGLRGLWLQGL